MRLVPFGPDLPDELLEERDAGNVVFFCGAGISRPAGLPGFFDLTRKAISRLGVPEGAASIALFNRIKNDRTFPQRSIRSSACYSRNTALLPWML
jgi:NAD-dependent SIR2 family protein deacetylase